MTSSVWPQINSLFLYVHRMSSVLSKIHGHSRPPRLSRHRHNFKLAHLRDQSHPFIISWWQALELKLTHFLLSLNLALLYSITASEFASNLLDKHTPVGIFRSISCYLKEELNTFFSVALWTGHIFLLLISHVWPHPTRLHRSFLSTTK